MAKKQKSKKKIELWVHRVDMECADEVILSNGILR